MTERMTEDGTAHGLLLGSDHTRRGTTTVETITPQLAIGISCGRFPKGYPHVDPNEDAAFAVTDGTTAIIAVADGHHGFDAAEAAMAAINGAAEAILDQPLDVIITHLTQTALDAITWTVPPLAPPRDSSRTALTIAAIRDDQMSTVTWGDTACFVATHRRATRIASHSEFLGPGSELGIEAIVTPRVPQGAAVVLASDGILDFVRDPKSLFRTISTQPATDAVGAVMAAAFSGGAGDNIAAAICMTKT